MNKTFNANRFGRLFYKHTTEHYKGYLMALSVLVGVMVLGGSFIVYMMEMPIDKNFQTVIFMIFLLLAGTIFTSTIFAELGEKKKAIAWLMLPASHFEKFLVAWIYSFLAFIVIYTICFYSITLFALTIKQFPGKPPMIFSVFEQPVPFLFITYAFLHGFTICGAVWFEKLHFIKTGFVFFIALALLIFFNKLLLDNMLGINVEASPPFSNMRIIVDGTVSNLNVTKSQSVPYVIYLVSVLAVVFWIAAYYRLKEKQV